MIYQPKRLPTLILLEASAAWQKVNGLICYGANAQTMQLTFELARSRVLYFSIYT